MACSIVLNNIGEFCGESLGGIVKMWVAPHTTANATITTDKYTADDTQFKVIEFPQATGSMTSTYNVNQETRTFYVSTDIAVQLPNLAVETSKVIDQMVRGGMAVVVKTAVGKYWGFGEDFPVRISAATAQTGTQMADLQGYNVTFQSTAAHMPSECDTAFVAKLEAIVAQ